MLDESNKAIKQENNNGDHQKDGDKEYTKPTREELIEQLSHQVSHMDSLPEHVKFYFCTNADLQYFMALVLHILKSN